MSFHIQKKLPSIEQVLKKLPLSKNLVQKVAQDRAEICDILSGKDFRRLLIVGPCSAWPSKAVIEYARKLKPLAEKCSEKLKVVMRTYIQKPRTIAGWMGPLIQPDPFGKPDLETGILTCREMMIEILDIGLPIADEILFPRKEGYFRDVLSWVAVGARSSENQEHRILASGLDIAVGLKNPTSGDLKIAANSVVAAQTSHVFGIAGEQVQTSGNQFAHLVLRGGEQPNYQLENLKTAISFLQNSKVKNPAIIVDASHRNSIVNGKKDFHQQTKVIFDVLDSMKKDVQISKIVKGFMVESFLKSGKQDLKNFKNSDGLEYGVSVTDGCLGWEQTQKLIEDLAKKL